MGDQHIIKFNCRDQFKVVVFVQFADRDGLGDIETTLNLCGDLYRSCINVIFAYAEVNKENKHIYQDCDDVNQGGNGALQHVRLLSSYVIINGII